MNTKRGIKEVKCAELKFRHQQRIAIKHIAKDIETELLKNLEISFESGAIPNSWKINKGDNRTAEAITNSYCRNRTFTPVNREDYLIFEYLHQFI